MGIALSSIINNMALNAGMDSTEADKYSKEFLDSISGDSEILEEFIYYIRTGNFLCKYKTNNLSVVDIMVWQIDHFKAHLDRGHDEMKHNPNMMVLKAFETMMKIKSDPAKYLQLFGTETGTDYPGHHE